MAKVKINKLPKGYIISNGKVIRYMKEGGFTTGDQYNYGLVTFPQLMNGGEGGSDIPFFPSGGTINNTLKPVDRDEANIEAEKNETVLTDLNNDGIFELYNIGGKRHNGGGTPLSLPEESFIYSDTRSMKLTKDELEELNIDTVKRETPAKTSKRFQLNKYTEVLNDPFSDKIATDSAEYMLNKNKRKLSHLAFIQEAKKDFEEGVPHVAFPYLKEKGIDPEKYSRMIAMLNQKEEAATKSLQTPPTDQEKMQLLNQFIGGRGSNQAPPPQQGMPPMGPPQQEMMAQGPPPGMIAPQGQQGPPQQMMPPQGMMPPQVPVQQQAPMAMAKYGGSLPIAQEGTTITDFETNWSADRNKKVREAFYEHYAAQINVDELTDDQKAEIDKLLIKDNKIKGLMHENFDEDYFSGEDWDDGTNTKYNLAIDKLKQETDWDGTGLTDNEIGQIQDAHIVLDSMTRMSEYDDIMKTNNVSLNLSGPDETGNVGQKSTLSAKDNLAGDNFINTFVNTSYTTEPGDTTDKVNLPPVKEYFPPEAEAWKQDDMRLMGSIMDKFKIKKRYPALTQLNPDYIDPAYLSPTRQFAKIAELTAQSADTANTFAGPKRGLAVLSKANAEAIGQLSDVAADVDNKNLQIYDTTEQLNTQIFNETEKLNKAALADFYDKTNLTEENYDAQMRMADNAVLDQVVNRETNKWKTYNLNTLYKNFDIDPGGGGGIYNVNQSEFYPTEDYDQNQYDAIKERVEQLVADGTISKDQAHELLKKHIDLGLPGQKTQNPYASPIANMFNYPGAQSYNPYGTNPFMQSGQMNPYMMQYMQQQQQSPYGKRGTEVGYIPEFPFTVKRKKRKLINQM